MQKSYFAVRWVGFLLALACAIGLPAALYAAEEQESVAEPGVVVVALDPAGPAAAAGVKRGDIILAVDGNPVNALADLVTILSTLPVETAVTLQVQHGDTMQAVTVTPILRDQRAYLGILPYAAPTPAVAPSAPPVPPVPSVEQPTPLQTLPAVPPLPDVMAQTVTITPSLVILEVMQGSAAAAAGLQPQDLITAVDGSAVTAPEALRAHLASLQPGDTITLTITRGDAAPRPVSLRIGKGTAGQALLGVKLGMVVTAVASQGQAQLSGPALPVAGAVPNALFHFQQVQPFEQWAMPAPGCMVEGVEVMQGVPAPQFMQLPSDTLTIEPLSSEWVAQPALPADQNTVVIVRGQVGQAMTRLAQPLQQGMVMVAPTQPMAGATQSVTIDEQGNVTIRDEQVRSAPVADDPVEDDQAMPVQPAMPAVPAVGDYY